MDSFWNTEYSPSNLLLLSRLDWPVVYFLFLIFHLFEFSLFYCPTFPPFLFVKFLNTLSNLLLLSQTETRLARSRFFYFLFFTFSPFLYCLPFICSLQPAPPFPNWPLVNFDLFSICPLFNFHFYFPPFSLVLCPQQPALPFPDRD